MVRLARCDEVPELASALAQAFEHDPALSPLVAGPRRTERLQLYFELEARHVLAHCGEVWVDDDLRAAAIWRRPEAWGNSPLAALRLLPGYIRVFRRQTAAASRAATALQRVHPRSPHWYLPFVGVEPAAAGNGLGSALLEPVLDRCDQHGIGAYLEATSAASARLFARHGFAPSETVEFLPGASVTPMWRAPSGPSE